MKIAVILFRTLGDILMGTTVVHALKQKYPDSKIDFITEKQNVNILQDNPDINRVIVYNNYFEANVYCADNKYDKVFRLNMANHLETCWHHLPQHQNQHLVEWYAKKCGIDVLDDKNIYVHLSDSDKENVEKVWNELPKKDRVIAIHTSSGAHGGVRVESKDWSLDRFNALAEKLTRAEYNVVQIGISGDKKITYPHITNIFDKLTFKQNLGFLQKCMGYVGVDSGPSYLAGQSGIPSLIIMGSTQNQEKNKINSGPSVGPRNDNVHYINPDRPNNPMCKPVPCYTHCQVKSDVLGHGIGISCIDLISVDNVYGKLIEITRGK